MWTLTPEGETRCAAAVDAFIAGDTETGQHMLRNMSVDEITEWSQQFRDEEFEETVTLKENTVYAKCLKLACVEWNDEQQEISRVHDCVDVFKEVWELIHHDGERM